MIWLNSAITVMNDVVLNSWEMDKRSNTLWMINTYWQRLQLNLIGPARIFFVFFLAINKLKDHKNYLFLLMGSKFILYLISVDVYLVIIHFTNYHRKVMTSIQVLVLYTFSALIKKFSTNPLIIHLIYY